MNDLRGPRKELCAQRAHLSPGTRLLPLRTDTLPAVGPRAEWEDLRNRPHVLALDYSGTSSPCQDLESTHLKSYRGAHRRLIENLNQRLTHSTTPEAPVTVTARRDYVRAVRPRYAQVPWRAKPAIPDGFCATTGSHRAYALTLLHSPERPAKRPPRHRPATYSAQVVTILAAIWEAARYPGGAPQGDAASGAAVGDAPPRHLAPGGAAPPHDQPPPHRSSRAGPHTAALRLGRLLKTASPSRPPMGRSRPRALPRGTGSLTPATPPTEASSRR